MECNREEAIRAKGIAEKKMKDKDFMGARKFALKAQNLYPDLENISQMIMICNVHCAAENKVSGNEKDWYDILQIEPTADEASIKRQYKKFALLLHPDKNKAEGADDAFMLVVEAQKVLSDREKRMLFDCRRKASGRSKTPQWTTEQMSRQSSVFQQFPLQNNFKNSGSSQFMNLPQQATQPGVFSRPTFWTMCFSCGNRYQYYKEVMNKRLMCQICKQSFKASEINSQGAESGTNACDGQHGSGNQYPKKVEPQSLFGNSAKVRAEGSVRFENPVTDSFAKTGCSSKAGKESEPNLDVEKMNGKKRKKKLCKSNDSFGMGGSSNVEEDIVSDEAGDNLTGQNSGCYSEKFPKRSTRARQHVSYNENLSEGNDLRKPSKRVNSENSTGLGGADVENSTKKVKREEFYCCADSLQDGEKNTRTIYENGTGTQDEKRTSSNKFISKSNASPDTSKEPELYEYSDPEFSDFDKHRTEKCFAVNQIWAVYDTLDAMPRFYVRIRKIFSSGFKVRITWLEPDPENENEIKWVNEGLPVSCGKFRQGDSEYSEDHAIFSHLVSWETGSGKDSYTIFPRKGETWALFKSWDINWCSEPDSKKNFKFEFVEVLTDFDDNVGVHVAYLGKMKGFVCLFYHMKVDGMDSVLVPPHELFRFSHRVPSFQMTGQERADVPKASFELDPACLPANLEAIAFPEIMKIEAAKAHPNVLCSKSSSCNNRDNVNQLDNASSSSPETYEIPEPEFYNFDADKTKEKFQVGQFWALYSDEDCLPKYYGRIKKIDHQPEFKIHVNWLQSCPVPKNMIKWLDEEMLVCCGKFKVQRGKTEEYNETGAFSHQVKAEKMRAKDVYVIYPQKSQVWALYKNWNVELTCSDLKNCEYDIVEVLEENDSWISVLFLELVGGSNSIFKPKMQGRSSVTVKIPLPELLRFSHQIPAFQLTKERGGDLLGFWELDTAAMPVHFFPRS